MATDTRPAAYGVASKVQATLENAMGPGGPLHLPLSAFLGQVSDAADDAIEAAGGNLADRGAYPAELLDRVTWEIAETFVKVVLRDGDGS